MRVSVIIPVYNAADFVQEAVESALAQPETAEVILVEDGSTDGSLDVCKSLATGNQRVVLYCHHDGANHGAGASRNLGILNATSDFVAFLDADDFFLPRRFWVAKNVFATDPSIDGVYEAIGTHINDQVGLVRWLEAGFSSEQITTVSKKIAPENLLSELTNRNSGYFSIDGLTVKRTIFEKTGPFDEHLALHQDTAMIFRMAALGRLMPGNLDTPVAMRRIHDHNRYTAPRSPLDIYRKRSLAFETIWLWAKTNLDPQKEQILLVLYLKIAANWPAKGTPAWIRFTRSRFLLAKLILRHPQLIKSRTYWSNLFPIRRVVKSLRVQS